MPPVLLRKSKYALTPSSKQVSTHVPSGLLEFVPSDEKWISVSVTPGTPLIGTCWVVSWLAVEPAPAPDAAVVGFVSLELLHAPSSSVNTAPSRSERRSRTWGRM